MQGDDDEDIDLGDADQMTELAANFRAGSMPEAAIASRLAMEATEEHEANAPAAYEMTDRLLTWFGGLGSEFGEKLLERLGGDLTENLIRAEQYMEDSPDADEFRAAVARGDRRTAFDLLVTAAEYSNTHRLPIEPHGYAHVPEPPAEAPSDRMAIQAKLDELYRQYPVGSAEYRSPAVQNKIAGLFAALEGEGPVCGRGGRVI